MATRTSIVFSTPIERRGLARRPRAESGFEQPRHARLQHLGLRLGKRHRRAHVQAHAVEQAAPERPHHGASCSMRLKYEPQRLVSAIGITGTSRPSARALQDLHDTALERLELSIARDAAFGEDGQQVAVPQHLGSTLEGGLVGRGVFLVGAMGMALARRNSQPSTGTRKMRWSMTK